MRPVVRDFMTDIAALDRVDGPIVEIGARPAEGQETETNLRGLFQGATYIGCDVQEGVGVDRVEDVHQLTFEDSSVALVLMADTLEHVSDPIRALEEVHRVLKPGGMVAMTSVMFFIIHAHPWDFWRFTPEGFQRLLEPFDHTCVTAEGWELMPETVLGVGVKGDGSIDLADLPRTAARVEQWGVDKPVEMGPIRMSIPQLWRFTLRQSASAARRKLHGRRNPA